MVKTIKVKSRHNLIKANNPSVGDKVWTLRGVNNENSFEHIITEQITNEVFKTNKTSSVHIDNIWYKI